MLATKKSDKSLKIGTLNIYAIRVFAGQLCLAKLFRYVMLV